MEAIIDLSRLKLQTETNGSGTTTPVMAPMLLIGVTPRA